MRPPSLFFSRNILCYLLIFALVAVAVGEEPEDYYEDDDDEYETTPAASTLKPVRTRNKTREEVTAETSTAKFVVHNLTVVWEPHTLCYGENTGFCTMELRLCASAYFSSFPKRRDCYFVVAKKYIWEYRTSYDMVIQAEQRWPVFPWQLTVFGILPKDLERQHLDYTRDKVFDETMLVKEHHALSGLGLYNLTNGNLTVSFSFEIVCNTGWYGKDCSRWCQQLTSQVRGGFECTPEGDKICIAGWEGDVCDVAICREGCVHGSCWEPSECGCFEGWMGDLCDECRMLPGCFSGHCDTPHQCICDRNYTGFLCTDPPVCSPSCVHGECLGGDTCICHSGWSGQYCRQCVPHRRCQHGTCKKPRDCICEENWGGVYCDTPLCPNCVNGDCAGPDTCRCHHGWQGANCSQCIPLDGCLHGTCSLPNECNCESDWIGIFCERKNVSAAVFEVSNLRLEWNPLGNCYNDGSEDCSVDVRVCAGPFYSGPQYGEDDCTYVDKQIHMHTYDANMNLTVGLQEIWPMTPWHLTVSAAVKKNETDVFYEKRTFDNQRSGLIMFQSPNSVMLVKLNFAVHCSDYLYGPNCNVYCNEEHKFFAGGSFKCLPDGSKKCDHGWDGIDCRKPICEQGCYQGDCLRPGVCQCWSDWYGPACEENDRDPVMAKSYKDYHTMHNKMNGTTWNAVTAWPLVIRDKSRLPKLTSPAPKTIRTTAAPRTAKPSGTRKTYTKATMPTRKPVKASDLKAKTALLEKHKNTDVGGKPTAEQLKMGWPDAVKDSLPKCALMECGEGKCVSDPVPHCQCPDNITGDHCEKELAIASVIYVFLLVAKIAALVVMLLILVACMWRQVGYNIWCFKWITTRTQTTRVPVDIVLMYHQSGKTAGDNGEVAENSAKATASASSKTEGSRLAPIANTDELELDMETVAPVTEEGAQGPSSLTPESELPAGQPLVDRDEANATEKPKKIFRVMPYKQFPKQSTV